MFRSLTSRVGVLALTATMVGVPVVGLASSAGAAAPNANRCQSINGVVVYQSGTATCVSDQSTGSDPNVATATGNNSFAGAQGGDNNTATAIGDSSLAASGAGNDNSATAHGPFSFAIAGFGNGNTSSANGPFSNASAGIGSSDTATANGAFSKAQAGPGDSNTATANGPCTTTLINVSGETDSCHP